MNDYRDIIGGEPGNVPDRADATLTLARHLSEAVRGLNHTTQTDSGIGYASSEPTITIRDVIRASLEHRPTHRTDRPPEPPAPDRGHGRTR